MPDDEALRLFIRAKLAGGRLTREFMSHVWGGPARGEVCDACDKSVPKSELVIETLGPSTTAALRFHVRCFYLWAFERDAMVSDNATPPDQRGTLSPPAPQPPG